MIRVVSFYTEGYERYADGLRRSCERFGLEHEIVPLEGRPTRQENLHLKPWFIWESFKATDDRDILWIDADAAIMAPPDILTGPGDFDVAAYFALPDQPWSGTILFRRNSRAGFSLWRWARRCEELGPEVDHDIVLGEVLAKTYDFRIMKLPPAYCWVAERMRAKYPGARPVIQHFQAGKWAG